MSRIAVLFLLVSIFVKMSLQLQADDTSVTCATAENCDECTSGGCVWLGGGYYPGPCRSRNLDPADIDHSKGNGLLAVNPAGCRRLESLKTDDSSDSQEWREMVDQFLNGVKEGLVDGFMGSMVGLVMVEFILWIIQRRTVRKFSYEYEQI